MPLNQTESLDDHLSELEQRIWPKKRFTLLIVLSVAVAVIHVLLMGSYFDRIQGDELANAQDRHVEFDAYVLYLIGISVLVFPTSAILGSLFGLIKVHDNSYGPRFLNASLIVFILFNLTIVVWTLVERLI